MGDIKGFLKVKRQNPTYRPVCERVKDFNDTIVLRNHKKSEEQAGRCMDCGTPFCHWGCPVANFIPEWNDLVFTGHWKKALALLSATNSFPEFTGRLCPALCEYACVLGINDDPVTIREDELAIIEYAFKKGYIKPNPPLVHTGKKVAVIGSGPAGLSCADILNKIGHTVTVFERDDKIGGILRYGIPDFKLEKNIIDRRLKILKAEGIKFVIGKNVGVDLSVLRLKKEFDAVCLTCGSRVPRDLDIEGRSSRGIYFAMDYLMQSNKRAKGKRMPKEELIDAKGRRVVVIGGGDTGADCVGTAHRQGAICVIQIELLPRPAECRTDAYPWPMYPLLLKTSTSHEEGGQRQWAVLTKKFIARDGYVKELICAQVEFSSKDEKGCPIIKEVPGSEFKIDADLVILAMGFVHPEHNGLVKELGLKVDGRGNINTDVNYMTSVDGVFSAGDMRRGQSLVVWAIYEGSNCAGYIDKYLKKQKK